MGDTPLIRKARGAFFTPDRISDFVAKWAIRRSDDKVLEPSCGEAQFLLAAGRSLRELGAVEPVWRDRLHGIEIHKSSADRATELLRLEKLDASIRVGDFFDVPAMPQYDAVIGNPPYVRYQQFAGHARAKALEAAFSQGIRLTGLASSWAAFVIHSTRFLKPEGRLGLVLPAELLTVNYAAQVRKFLLERFANVRLMMFEDRVFPGVLEEVVLLLAEGTGGAKHFEVYQARSLEDLQKIDAEKWVDFAPQAEEKWTPALLASDAFSTYRHFANGTHFSPLLAWGETYLGAVTGNNNYFALTHEQAREMRLKEGELVRISPPGSRHLKGLKFSDAAWQTLQNQDARCLLFFPDAKRPSAAARRYIELGEQRRVHNAYKCENREPWWRVPLVAAPDILFTYMNHDRPRLITNNAGVHILNSIYGVTLHPRCKKLGRDLLPIASLNSVTLLGAEIVGRAYGGGLLKMEPKEADRLPMPSEKLLIDAAHDLKMLRPQLATALRQANLYEAVEMVDEVILTKHAGANKRDVVALREAREVLFQRRSARGRGLRVEN